MGPVSAFGFSVWGWARFGALGWGAGAAAGAGTQGAALGTGAGRWAAAGQGSHECRQGITGRQHGWHG